MLIFSYKLVGKGEGPLGHVLPVSCGQRKGFTWSLKQPLTECRHIHSYPLLVQGDPANTHIQFFSPCAGRTWHEHTCSSPLLVQGNMAFTRLH
jgi:hypothetical protein